MPALTVIDRVEPVTLEEMRLQLNLDAEGSPPAHPHDPLIEIYIAAAREWAEAFTGQVLAQTRYEYTLDAFPAGSITLPVTPIVAVEPIAYTDAQSPPQAQTFAAYTRDGAVLTPDDAWPDGTEVSVTFDAGYDAVEGSPAVGQPMPQQARLAIMLLASHWYRVRESVSDKPMQEVPMGAEALLKPLRLHRGFA